VLSLPLPLQRPQVILSLSVDTGSPSSGGSRWQQGLEDAVQRQAEDEGRMDGRPEAMARRRQAARHSSVDLSRAADQRARRVVAARSGGEGAPLERGIRSESSVLRVWRYRPGVWQVSEKYPDFFYLFKIAFSSDTPRIRIQAYPMRIRIGHGIRYWYVSFVKYTRFIVENLVWRCTLL